jgi:hypothetical protein
MRRTIEVHVRKIRETESGGEPTSLDYPVLFEMNKFNTGFVNKFSSKPMFTSILKVEAVQKIPFESLASTADPAIFA